MHDEFQINLIIADNMDKTNQILKIATQFDQFTTADLRAVLGYKLNRGFLNGVCARGFVEKIGAIPGKGGPRYIYRISEMGIRRLNGNIGAQKTCVQCGNVFTGRKNQIYCSIACRNKIDYGSKNSAEYKNRSAILIQAFLTKPIDGPLVIPAKLRIFKSKKPIF